MYSSYLYNKVQLEYERDFDIFVIVSTREMKTNHARL